MAHKILEEAQEMNDLLIKWRRDLHQIPETDLELPKTVEYIGKRLDEMNVEYKVFPEVSVIIAQIGKGDKCFLLRSDMDALPVEEETGLEFASKNGCMHGCGHDLHATILLGAAKILKAHEEECVGMAANMIGVRKNIIAVHMGFMNVLMYNPKIIKKSGAYETEEGCLSLAGVRKCMRYQEIEVQYQDVNFKQQRQTYSGWIAQIIQHEIDHCCGILI